MNPNTVPEREALKSEAVHGVIVLPTYNERGNIEKLLDAILGQRAIIATRFNTPPSSPSKAL